MLPNKLIKTDKGSRASIEVDDSLTEQQIRKQIQLLTNNTLLDVDDAVIKLQYKQGLYIELVNNFWRNYQHLATELEYFYQENNIETLYRMVHSLKSTAQYIGAYELSYAANLLESELNAQGEHIERKLNEVNMHLVFLITQLARIFKTSTSAVENNTLDFDLNQAESLISQLKPLLTAGDTQAEELSDNLYDLGKNTFYFQRIKSIHQQINNFDFDDALKQLCLLEQAINE